MNYLNIFLFVYLSIIFTCNSKISAGDEDWYKTQSGHILELLPSSLNTITGNANSNIGNEWSEWKYCQPGTGVVGFQLGHTHSGGYNEQTSIIQGIVLLCGTPFETNKYTAISTRDSGHWEDLGEPFICVNGTAGMGELSLINDMISNFKIGCINTYTGKKTVVGKSVQTSASTSLTELHVNCTDLQFICGFSTKHFNQALEISGIQLKCCDSLEKDIPTHEYTSGQILVPPVSTDWGEWSYWEYCPINYYVFGMRLKVDHNYDDESGLNGIKFICANPKNYENTIEITSGQTPWGEFKEAKFCDDLRMASGFKLRSESYQGAKEDDTAANNIGLYCQSINETGTYYIEGDGTGWGEWGIGQSCSDDQLICGLQTQILVKSAPTRIFNKTDRIGLNNFKVKCCNVPNETLELIYSQVLKAQTLPEYTPSYANVEGEILSSKHHTNFGEWTDGEFCPVGTFVVGMQLKSDNMKQDDQLGLTGIKLFCSSNYDSYYLTNQQKLLPSITSGVAPGGVYGKKYFCNGVAIGFEMKVETHQGPYGDDTGTNNLKIKCLHISQKSVDILEGDGSTWGEWDQMLECSVGEVICGLQTQVDEGTGSNDKTGINNINLKCCNIDNAKLLGDELYVVDTDISAVKSYSDLYTDILHSPVIIDIGTWGPWTHCENGKKIIGFQLKKYENLNKQTNFKTILTGIKLYCGQGEDLTSYISSLEHSMGEFRNIALCNSNNYAIGFQLSIELDEFQHDNFRLICSGDSNTQHVLEDVENATTTVPRIWTEIQTCSTGQFVCGFRTQIYETENDDDTEEMFGISNGVSNIDFRCCDPNIATQRISKVKVSKKSTMLTSHPLTFDVKEINGKIIESPKGITQGIWHEWEYCPLGTYVMGMQLKEDKTFKVISTDTIDINGVKLICSDPLNTKSAKKTYISSGSLIGRSYGIEYICEDSAFATGFQVYSKIFYGTKKSITFEIVSLRLYCYNGETGETSMLQNKSPDIFTKGGLFTGKQICESNQYICGIQTQLDGKYKAPGVEGIKMKCCDFSQGANTTIVERLDQSKYKNVAGRILRSALPPPLNPMWSQWDYCDDGSYVIGMKLKSGLQTSLAASNLQGIKLICQNIKFPEEKQLIGKWESPWGRYRPDIIASGVVIGFQILSSGVGREPRNIRLYQSDVIKQNFTEGDGPSWSNNDKWEYPQLCKRGQAVCGIQTQINFFHQPFGIKMINFKCCQIPHPASVCIPVDSWQLLTICDASEAVSSTTCTFSEQTGTTITDSLSNSERLEKVFSENLGFETGLSETKSLEMSNSTSVGKDQSIQNGTQIDQGKSKSSGQEIGNSNTEHKDQSKQSTQSQETSNSHTSHQQSTHTADFSVDTRVSVSASASFLGFASVSTEISTNFHAGYSYSNTHGTSDTSTSGSSSSQSQISNEGQSKSSSSSKSQSWSETENKSGSSSMSSSHSNQWGFNLAQGITSGVTKSQSSGKSAGLTTGYDWSQSTSKLWSKETTNTVTLDVPPGVITTLYQAVGKCSFYEVRAVGYRRVDTIYQNEQLELTLKKLRKFSNYIQNLTTYNEKYYGIVE